MNFIISELKIFVSERRQMTGSEKIFAMFKTTKEFLLRIYKKKKKKTFSIVQKTKDNGQIAYRRVVSI